MAIKSVRLDLGNDRPVIIETGKMANQANGSITIRQGDTMLLIAAVASDPKPGQSFFPLQIDYREKFTAAGKFPGGFMKREGRPSEKEVLTMRMTDRPLRPLFPKGFMDETQVYGLLLSYDGQNEPDVLNIFGAAVALLVSDIPFNTLCAAIRVARVNGEFIANPTKSEMEESDLDLIYSGVPGKTIMIEGDCDELSEEELRDSLTFADGIVTNICETMADFIQESAKPNKESKIFEVADSIQTAVNEFCEPKLAPICAIADKKSRNKALKELATNMKAAMIELFPQELENADDYYLNSAYDEILEKVVRSTILAGKPRMDGRTIEDLRPLSAEVDLIPHVHGSALFSRGETQALVITAMGSEKCAQMVEVATEDVTFKKFMLHYNFPNYSVGETGRIMGPGRREIGHGHLAERSVAKMLPEDYPYTVRCISEIMSSNGSTSMASICGATLSLMDAGVPMIRPVAGISCGLVTDDSQYMLLTDILGDEDHFGDMDFKVAGTRDGITGFQLDLKIAGISIDLMYEAMLRNKTSRMQILDVIEECIAEPRSELKPTAPQMGTIKVDTDKIGAIIGQGGKNIKELTERTGTDINIADDGTISIFGVNKPMFDEALKAIEAINKGVEVGEIYDGTVVNIRDFGAFVELIPGCDGMVHISELANQRVNTVTDVCQVGDKLKVKVLAIDDRGKISLSHKALLNGAEGNDSSENNDIPKQEVETGEIYRGKVIKIMGFGAIVELFPGVDGMVHISEMADHRIDTIEDICVLNDSITVKSLGRDNKGRLRLSRKAALAEMD